MLEHSGQVVWFHECNCDVRWIWYYWTCGSQEGNIYNCSRLRHRTHLHVSPTWLLDCMGSTPLFPIRELGDCVWVTVSSPPMVLLASWLRWAQGIQNFHVHELWSGHPIFGVSQSRTPFWCMSHVQVWIMLLSSWCIHPNWNSLWFDSWALLVPFCLCTITTDGVPPNVLTDDSIFSSIQELGQLPCGALFFCPVWYLDAWASGAGFRENNMRPFFSHCKFLEGETFNAIATAHNWWKLTDHGNTWMP
jgi:hypothetical protein